MKYRKTLFAKNMDRLRNIELACFEETPIYTSYIFCFNFKDDTHLISFTYSREDYTNTLKFDDALVSVYQVEDDYYPDKFDGTTDFKYPIKLRTDVGFYVHDEDYFSSVSDAFGKHLCSAITHYKPNLKIVTKF